MEENLMEQEQTEKGIDIRELFLIIKRHLLLILAIVFTFSLAGVVYSFIVKPEYTVTQKIGYKCENKGAANTTTQNINTMIAYGETIIDLFDEGVVLDRANYYYKEYMNKKAVSEDEAEAYLNELSVKAKGNAPDMSYTPSDIQLNYIDSKKVSTVQLSTTSESVYAFNIKYTDDSVEEARVKISILANAFALECKETKLVNGQEAIKYFGEFEVIVSDLGEEKVESSVSKLKTVVLFFIIGAVVALATVLVVHFLDKTVKSKSELEELVGAPVLSAVEKEV